MATGTPTELKPPCNGSIWRRKGSPYQVRVLYMKLMTNPDTGKMEKVGVRYETVGQKPPLRATMSIAMFYRTFERC